MTLGFDARQRISDASQRRSSATAFGVQTVNLDLPRVYGITQNDNVMRQMRRVIRRGVARVRGCTRPE